MMSEICSPEEGVIDPAPFTVAPNTVIMLPMVPRLHLRSLVEGGRRFILGAVVALLGLVSPAAMGVRRLPLIIII